MEEEENMTAKRALEILRERPLRFGDGRQIEAARFLERCGMQFSLEHFMTEGELLEYRSRYEAVRRSRGLDLWDTQQDIDIDPAALGSRSD